MYQRLHTSIFCALKNRETACAALLLIGFFPFCQSHTGSAISTYILGSCAIVVLLKAVLVFYFKNKTVTTCGAGTSLLVKHIAVAVGMGFILEMGTLFGSKSLSILNLHDWNIKRLALFIFISFVFLFASLYRFTRVEQTVKIRVARKQDSAISKKLFIYLFVGLLVGLIVATAGLVLGSYAPMVFAFFSIGMVLGVTTIIYLYRCGAISPERVFLAIALPAGIAIIIAAPASNLYSWDDEVHYSRAVEVSYIADVETTASDRMIAELFRVEPGFSSDASLGRFPIDKRQTWSWKDVDRLANELDANNTLESATVSEGIDPFVASITSIGYFPSAVGLWVGRLLHFSFSATFMLGRFFNLMTYCFVNYLAIKTIPTKKVLLSFIALFPTSLFMAANYSYDPWVIAFTHLGLAMFVREYVKQEGPSAAGVYSMLIVLFVAFCPKAVYFPIMGIVCTLLWYKNKRVRAGRYIAVALLLAGLLVMSFILPLLLPVPGDVGDLRGGPDVNSSMQLDFVLSNPLGYIIVLLRYLFGQYLTIPNFEQGVTNLAYMGSLNDRYSCFVGIVTVLLVAVSLLDSNKISDRLISGKTATWSAVIALCTLSLVCSSLYISFTAVGSDTIAGVQARYLLPLVFFVFCFLFNMKTRCSLEVNSLAVAVGGVSWILLYGTLWILIVSRIYC